MNSSLLCPRNNNLLFQKLSSWLNMEKGVPDRMKVKILMDLLFFHRREVHSKSCVESRLGEDLIVLQLQNTADEKHLK